MDLLTVALRVLVALVVIVAAVWFVQRRVGGRAARAPKPLRVVSRQSIGSKASVVMLDAEGQRFLLGVTDHGVSVLHTAEQPEPAEEFATALASAEKTRPVAAAPRELASFRVPGADPLAGSLLSPATWRRALDALRPQR
jgi:flagellar protein FliO/FliZ